MRVLIVEDDPFKLGKLLTALQDISGNLSVESAGSLQQAMETLETKMFDVVLLDMAIPSHASAPGSSDIYSQPVGGLDILLNLALQERPERIIIVTQYPTVEFNRQHVPLSKLAERLANDGVHNVRSVVMFSDDHPWRHQLSRALEADF